MNRSLPQGLARYMVLLAAPILLALSARCQGPRFSHQTIYVTDLDRAADFYEKVLQLKKIQELFHDAKHVWCQIFAMLRRPGTGLPRKALNKHWIMKFYNIVIKYRLHLAVVLLVTGILTNIYAGFWPAFLPYFITLILLFGYFFFGPLRLIQE